MAVSVETVINNGAHAAGHGFPYMVACRARG